jgi:hypothetical protein
VTGHEGSVTGLAGSTNIVYVGDPYINLTPRTDEGTEMANATARKRVLLIGKSQLVLDESVARLRELDYRADATNEFSDITARFDVNAIDLVVFGGQVPPDRKAELREEIGSINPNVIFVQGLAGIPGLIVNQVRGALAVKGPTRAPTYTPDDRSIRLTLTSPANGKVTLWWQTSFVPPDPKSDSLVILDDYLAGGDHAIPVPEHVPRRAAFATVQIDESISAFSIATEQ